MTRREPTQAKDRVVAIRHLNAVTKTPDPFVAAEVQRATEALSADIEGRTGIVAPDLPIHWADAAHFRDLRDRDWYQGLHRPPAQDTRTGQLGCPAAYLPAFGFIVAARARVGEPFPLAAIAHALAEASLCDYLQGSLVTLRRRYPGGSLFDAPEGLDPPVSRAVDKLLLLRATTLGIAQAAMLAHAETLFSRSQMHRLWLVPMPLTLTAAVVAQNLEMQRITPYAADESAYQPGPEAVIFAALTAYDTADGDDL